MESKPVGFSIGPGRTLTLPIDSVAVSSAARGIYELSFWVHCFDLRTRSWEPSDGAPMAGAVELLPDATDLFPDPLGSRSLWITSVNSPRRLVEGQSDVAQLTIANGTAQPLAAEAWFFLSKPGDTDPWLDHLPSVSGAVREVLPAAGLTTVSLSLRRPPAPGSYELSAWLHQEEASADVPADGVWLTTKVTVVAAGVHLTTARGQ
jgi:hypothetical protein